MDRFAVPDASPEEFVARATSALRERDLDELVSLGLRGDELEVRFSKLGTTILRYQIERRDAGFAASLVEACVAPLHAPFRDAFDQRFAEVAARIGARIG